MRLVADQTGERLDVFLTRQHPEYSRSFWQKMCSQNEVLVNDAPGRPKDTVRVDDVVTFELPETPDFTGQELPVLYQDDDVIVINKPTGVLTHAKGTLSHEFSVAEFVRPLTSDQPESNRPGIVHRLDRGTSGVIIAAKNPEAKRWLQKQFSTRKVKKTYVALVQGHPKEPAAHIVLPIQRNPKQPQTFRVAPSGKPAETSYATLQTFKNATLLELKPTTGRTHQLRVHLAHIGCPIVGDELYGRKMAGLDRMFLHAQSLEITLPSRERQTFTAPLPPELQRFLDTLQ